MSLEHGSAGAVLVIAPTEYVATRLIEALAAHPSYRPIPLIEGTAQSAWPQLEVRRSDPTSPVELAKALEGVKGDAVIDGELVAIGKDGVSHFQLLQNALRHEAKLLYCAFDLMFENAVDLRKQPLLERKKRLKAILPRDKLVAFSAHRKGTGTKFFAEAGQKGLEGVMAKRADSAYTSGSRTPDWLKIKTAKRQEVVIAGFTAPKRTRPFFGAPALAVRDDDAWRYIGHVGTGFSHKVLEDLHSRLVKLITLSCQSEGRGRDDLGKALAGCRGQIRGVDGQRRTAPARLPRTEVR